jgi:hypothetical protein
MVALCRGDVCVGMFCMCALFREWEGSTIIAGIQISWDDGTQNTLGKHFVCIFTLVIFFIQQFYPASYNLFKAIAEINISVVVRW